MHMEVSVMAQAASLETAEHGLPGEHGSNKHTVENTYGIPTGSQQPTHMGTSLTPDFKNSLAERPGAVRSATSGHRSAGGLDRVCPVRELSGE